jgi:hypothetical protein
MLLRGTTAICWKLSADGCSNLERFWFAEPRAVTGVSRSWLLKKLVRLFVGSLDGQKRQTN